MRYEEFKLIESNQLSDLETQKAIHDLNVIASTMKSLPPEKDNVKINVSKKLKNLSLSIGNFLKKANIQTQQ